MEEKNLYNKVMMFAFCLMVVLLCAGMYSWFQDKKAMPDTEIPRGNAQVLEWVLVPPVKVVPELLS